MAKKDYDALASFIIEHVGGKDNVVSLQHCVTRLRFRLKDEGKADTEALKNHQWIIDVVQKGGMYQVVIGNDVEDAYDAVMAAGGFEGAGSASAETEGDGKKKNIFNRAIELISSIFMPTIPILAASGIIKGVVAFVAAMGWLDSSSGTYQILYAIGNTMFYFLPVFVGYTSAKKFGMNEFTGLAIGAALCYPTLSELMDGDVIFTLFAGTTFETSATTTLFGIPVMLVTYTSTMLPSIVACYIGSKIEKVCKKYIPAVVKMFLVPAFSLLGAVIVTLLVFGPVVTWLSQGVAAVFTAIHDISPVLSGAIIGGTWQLLVVMGIHATLSTLLYVNLFTLGYENVICCFQCTPFVTMAVVLAVYFRTKDQKLKDIALPAAISSFFGVSEPSIYGVTLPNKKPFYFTLLCSGIGGALMGFFGTTMYTTGGMGIFALPAYINPEGFDMGFFGLFIALGVSMVLGFVLTYFFGLSEEAINGTSTGGALEEGEDESDLIKQEVFTSPVAGQMIELSEVADEVFASGTMGKGVGIKPSEGKVYAPADGTVTMLFPTGHAVGITTASNAELMVHIGVDTVQLEGKGFTAHVKQGDTVKQGQLLIEFDRELLASEGYDDTVVFIVSNSASFQDVVHAHDAEASNSRELLAVLA